MIGGLVLPVHQLYMDKYLTLFGDAQNCPQFLKYFKVY